MSLMILFLSESFYHRNASKQFDDLEIVYDHFLKTVFLYFLSSAN